jgi:hypothetical protein
MEIRLSERRIMTEITQEGWKNKALSMLLAQLTSYVLLIAATVIPSPGTVPIIPLIIAALTLAAFVVFWPFRGSMLDRIVTLVFGAISLIFVIVPFPTGKVPPDQTAADGSVLPWYSWALAMGLLLVVLVHCLTGCCAILNPASGHTAIITTVKPSFTVMVPAQWCCAGTATTSCVTRHPNHSSNLLIKTCQHG